ncbi:MAG: uroporphyrinogen decarboxylase family protein [Promethearchaeia archaeon]
MPLVNGYENDDMNALERILATVMGKETDRIPIFPMIDALPSEIFNLTIEEYFSSASNVINGQKKLQELLNLDYVSNFFYLALESELFGMESLFFENGSPNAGEPIASDLNFFLENEIPSIAESPQYQKTIETTKGLASEYKGTKPILSVQSAPFSLPSILMGSSKWFEAILMYPEKINDVLNFTLDFATRWAQGHLDAGADIIVLVDGVGTATSIPKDIFEEYVIPLYKKLNKQLDAPIVFYTAGGDMLPFADILPKTEIIGVFPSSDDNLAKFKEKAEGKYTLFGNLNNLELGDWPRDFMEKVIKKTIKIGKPEGNYILATQHMIPHGVSIEKIGDLISMALKFAYY